MKLIDRYVYAVTERLPADMREDVSKELRTNIEDMLPEDSTEQDARKVLEELGNPCKLANEYNPQKSYLIGPGLYDKYLTVLKMVLGIFAAVTVSITVIVRAVDPPIDGYLTKNLIELFVDLLITVIQGVLQGAVWVTLVFAILEKSGVSEGQIPFVNKKWSLDDLPTLPIYNKRKISRGETVFSMFCTIFFMSLLYGITQYTPLFIFERLQSYMIVIVLIVIIQLGISLWKFIFNSWSVTLAIANASYNAILCILLVVMISDKSLINQDFLSKIANKNGSIWISVAVFISICIWDSIAAFMKCKKEGTEKQ